MEQLIAGFSAQMVEAVKIASEADIRVSGREIRNVLMLGMGGSAFGGEVVSDLTSDKCKVPFAITRGYEIPGFVNENTLVIASSYSGNTEETLTSMQAAMKAGAEVVCISSNGRMAEIASESGLSIVKLPTGYPPRTAAGFTMLQVLNILRVYELIPDYSSDIQEAIGLVDTFDEYEPAREVARSLVGNLAVIYAGGKYESVAIRWRQQIEENSKQLAFHHVIPEMNHNELVGWKNPSDLVGKASVIFFDCDLDHPRNQTRLQINQEIIAPVAKHTTVVRPKGNSHLAQLIYLIHFGDWVSFYLAELNGEDPTPVEVIDYLKNELAKK